jgi:hypothetical protein
MATQSGTCVLVIAGQRYIGFEFSTDGNTKGTLGFLSGSAKVLKKARFMGGLQIQYADGSQQDISILVAHDSGMALFAFV